ncbi:hypothetical protein U1Q18_005389, partial [Sarracenia purpurea var. burkii]
KHDPHGGGQSPVASDDDDLFGRPPSFQRQPEFTDIQEEYVVDDLKNLKRKLLWAQEECLTAVRACAPTILVPVGPMAQEIRPSGFAGAATKAAERDDVTESQVPRRKELSRDRSLQLS